MKRIAIDANTQKPRALEVGKRIFELLEAMGASPYYRKELAQFYDKPYKEEEELPEALIVIGGDGTILNRAKWSMDNQIPLLGVNLGRIGFLNNVEESEVEEALKRLLADDFSILRRGMLQGEMQGETYCALNDFLVYKEHYSNTINVSVNIDDVKITTFSCDGILVSTPTGSTAYALSAGGPIIAPNVDAMLIAPICPHTLSARPLIVSTEDKIDIHIERGHCTRADVVVDGQFVNSLEEHHVLSITASAKPALFISINEYNFFELAQKKLY